MFFSPLISPQRTLVLSFFYLSFSHLILMILCEIVVPMSRYFNFKNPKKYILPKIYMHTLINIGVMSVK